MVADLDITTASGRRLILNGHVLTVRNDAQGKVIYLTMTDEQRRALADALRGPKPSDDLHSMVLSQAGHVHDLKADLADMTRERDEWKARAEAAERERDALREEQWPRDDIKPGDDVIYLGNRYGSSPCPRGAVFAVRAVHEESGRVSFDWPGVDGACVDLSRVRKVENRAEAAEARTAPAVTKADVEKALRESTNRVFQDEAYPHMADAIWPMLSGDDPALHEPPRSGLDMTLRELIQEAVIEARNAH